MPDNQLLDDVALPGLEPGPRRWAKTENGYLQHLMCLDYGDGWRFWGLAGPVAELTEHRGDRLASETDCVFLAATVGEVVRVRHALIVIASGEVLHSITYAVRGVS